MTAMGPLGIPMAREGSGTSWQPDSSPMYAAHRMAGPWQLMLHGNVFVQYVSERGDRGDDQFGSANWLMGMAHRSLAGGMLMLRAMLSAALRDRVFTVSAMTPGYSRGSGPFGSLVPALGGRVSINFVTEELEPFYGSRTPVGFTVFLNLRPKRMMEGGMGGMPMRHGAGQGRGVR